MNLNKRSGGAARLREKNKKILFSLADSNEKIDKYFRSQSNRVS